MNNLDLESYRNKLSEVNWSGRAIQDGQIFNDFISKEVADRFNDSKGSKNFSNHLNALSLTGFGKESLEKFLSIELPEERDWAIGEAIAEAWLESRRNIIWPWNIERDKKTPQASLPGADLVGFLESDGEVRLVIGEVKTSSQDECPPNVMYGKSGMHHQLDKLATDLSKIHQLIYWLLPRCKGTEFEDLLNKSLIVYFNSGNQAIALFGILIRDTSPSEKDLKSRGEALGNIISKPTSCDLIALYLPCEINVLPQKINRGEV